jgi:hypothetical protein
MLPTFIYKGDGSVVINKLKAHVRSFWITSAPKAIVVPALGTVRQVPYVVDTQGHFEWAYLMSRQTSPAFTVNIFDPGTRRNLMNNPIHAATLLGTAQRPGMLVETYLLNTENAGRELQFDFTDLSGAPNTVETVLHGRRWYQNEAPPDVQADIRKKFQQRERTTAYWLTTKVSPIVLGAGGELINNLAPLIEADDEADTEVFKLTASSTGPFEFRLRELASNRTLSNDFIRVESGFGTAQFPFVFQESLLIERNYDVAIDIRDVSGAPNTIFLTFWCRRLWYR